MFGRPVQEQSRRSARRGRRLHLEQLEDRCVPHTGVTLFADGLTAAAQPAGIVSGPDGNFWFTEFAADRVARITPTGTITEFVVPGAGSGPLNIVVGPDGALWFTENGSDEIGRITTAGVVTNEFSVPGVGSAPAGIAAGSDGALWFTQAGSGQIADSALLASFFAFAPGYADGTTVAFSKNVDRRDVIVGATAGTSHVKVIDGTKLTQVMPTGQIADPALRASFLAAPGFNGGVPLASDADHRDGTIFGPPGVTVANSRRDINDAYIFQSPTNPNNTVIALTVSPFSTATTPAAFEPGVLYDFRIVNRDLATATDDLTFRATFGPADANGVQDVALRALPGALFAGSAGVIVKGFTNQNVAVRGVGGTGAMFRAAEQNDPFFFDSTAFSRFLNGDGLSAGTTAANAAGQYPAGTSNAGAGDSDGDGLGFDPGEAPDYNSPNTFANANTLAITLEIPSTVLAGVSAGTVLVAEQNVIGLWVRTEANGAQQDRIGRPAINTALIPRGSAIANPAPDLRDAFNLGHPRDDAANYGAGVTSVLAAVYPIGGNNQASTVAGLQTASCGRGPFRHATLPETALIAAGSRAGKNVCAARERCHGFIGSIGIGSIGDGMRPVASSSALSAASSSCRFGSASR